MPAPSLCSNCKTRPPAAESNSGLCLVCLVSETSRSLGTSVPSSGPLDRPDFIPGSSGGPTRADAPETGLPLGAPEVGKVGGPEAQTAPAPQTKPSEPPPDLPPGYALINRLGGGGMGDVFLVRDTLADRLVAFKFLRAAHSSSAVTRFVTELQSLARIEHPNVVEVIHHDFYRAQPYLMMEYVRGGTLADRVQENGPLPPREAAGFILTVARAMTAIHAAKVIHRDLKPSNVLLTEAGAPKVSDFGLAKRLDDPDGDLTTTHSPLGTPAFMSPEQVSRRYGEISDHTDVYGLGSTLYFLLTGRPPFEGPREEVVAKVPRVEPDRLRSVCPDVDDALEAIVHKCLAKRPAHRYPTAAELAADLEHYVDGNRDKVGAPRLTPLRRLRHWAVRNRNHFFAAVGLAVLLVLVGWLASIRTDPETLKQRRKDRINDDILAGKRVVLVPDKVAKEPRVDWYDWLGAALPLTQSPTGDGACSFTATGTTGRLQLLAPPRDRYRLTAELQLLGADQGLPQFLEPGIGVFAGHTIIPRAAGEPNSASWVVSFMDVDVHAVNQGRPPTPRTAKLDWKYLLRGQKGLSTLQNQRLANFDFSPETDTPGPWWTVTMDVAPDRFRVELARANEEPRVLADLSRDEIRKQLKLFNQVLLPAVQAQAAAPINFGKLPDDWNPMGGAGIWCAYSRVAFRNVVVSPLP